MRLLKIALTFVLMATLGIDNHAQPLLAQHGSVTIDWKAELEKAQTEIAKDPKSAFWHNQAGVAYYSLGDFASGVRELKLASKLDPRNPIHDYALYGMYKRNGDITGEREALLSLIRKDPNNPLGHFELAVLLERQQKWTRALEEYKASKVLIGRVADVREYVDSQRNAYAIEAVRSNVDKSIQRVTKLRDSASGRK